jgi:hypothetical protein
MSTPLTAEEAIVEYDKPPSTCKIVHWLHSYDLSSNIHNWELNKTGKWLIFSDIDKIDKYWTIIDKATTEGKLGGHSKVSTAADTSYNPNGRVICVYTYDGYDEDDRDRVLKELHNLGFNWKLPYKFDWQTRAGIYSKPNFKPSSRVLSYLK